MYAATCNTHLMGSKLDYVYCDPIYCSTLETELREIFTILIKRYGCCNELQCRPATALKRIMLDVQSIYYAEVILDERVIQQFIMLKS